MPALALQCRREPKEVESVIDGISVMKLEDLLSVQKRCLDSAYVEVVATDLYGARAAVRATEGERHRFGRALSRSTESVEHAGIEVGASICTPASGSGNVTRPSPRIVEAELAARVETRRGESLGRARLRSGTSSTAARGAQQREASILRELRAASSELDGPGGSELRAPDDAAPSSLRR